MYYKEGYSNEDEIEVNFMTFADRKYKGTLERIGKEAEEMGIFKNIFLLTDSDLVGMPEEDLEFIRSNKRGYGYWIWKPYLIRRVLSRVSENSILIYADAGCKLESGAIGRLREYIRMVREHKSKMLTFQMGLKECIWTKMDTLNELGFISDGELNSGQVISGIILMENNEKVRGLIDEWYRVSRMYNYHLLDDSESRLMNAMGFMENRHDQSIFSILVKKNGIQMIGDETYERGDVPIQARRIKY
jgi:hypothetical protein